MPLWAAAVIGVVCLGAGIMALRRWRARRGKGLLAAGLLLLFLALASLIYLAAAWLLFEAI